MRKKKILFLLPFLLVAGLLLYCWATILTGEFLATWKHYIGLLLFMVITILLFRNFSKAVVGLGVFLLLATFNALAITPAITTNWLRIGALTTPPVQLSSFGLLLLYGILNLDTLIDMQLDYKNSKRRKAKAGLSKATKTGF